LLLEQGVAQVRAFDQQFYGKNATITMSDRDVIYVSRAVVPLMAKHGEGRTRSSFFGIAAIVRMWFAKTDLRPRQDTHLT
jgi:hypothetical protein